MAQVPPAAPYTGQQNDRWCGVKIKYDMTGSTAAGTAGVYTAAVVLPAYSYLLNVGLIGVTLWNNGSTAGCIVGDADDDNGIFTTVNLLSGGALLAGESVWVGFGTGMAGGVIGAYVANSQWANSSAAGQYRTAARTITCTLTTTGTVATTGETHMLVNYLNFSNSEPMTAASYVAS